MVQQLSKFVGLHIIRYCNHIIDATLARQADRFVAVTILNVTMGNGTLTFI